MTDTQFKSQKYYHFIEWMKMYLETKSNDIRYHLTDGALIYLSQNFKSNIIELIEVNHKYM